MGLEFTVQNLFPGEGLEFTGQCLFSGAGLHSQVFLCQGMMIPHWEVSSHPPCELCPTHIANTGRSQDFWRFFL